MNKRNHQGFINDMYGAVPAFSFLLPTTLWYYVQPSVAGSAGNDPILCARRVHIILCVFTADGNGGAALVLHRRRMLSANRRRWKTRLRVTMTSRPQRWPTRISKQIDRAECCIPRGPRALHYCGFNRKKNIPIIIRRWT